MDNLKTKNAIYEPHYVIPNSVIRLICIHPVIVLGENSTGWGNGIVIILFK